MPAPMPAPITFLDFARIAMVAYEPDLPRTDGGFARFGPMDRRLSGFQGAVYRRANGAGLDWVVGIAGTQATATGGADILADIGFGGPAKGGVLSLLGALQLERQCRAADELVANANQVMGRGDRLYVTGHSLGGGIAQITAARHGVPAVCFNPPTVTAVPGVEEDYRRTRVGIVCLQIWNDPINHTRVVGDWLGKVLTLPSPRGIDKAHSIDLTVEELSPQGPFTEMGARNPFAA